MVYIHPSTGFEEIEAITILDILRRGKVEAQFVSMTGELYVKGAHDILIGADILFEEADYEKCQMILLPGGMPGTTNLAQSKELLIKISDFADSGKYVGAICAAPLVLEKAGILKNKEATIYPGMEEHISMAKVKTNRVVVDGKVITSRGPGTAMEFSIKLLEILKGRETAQRIEKGLILNGK